MVNGMRGTMVALTWVACVLIVVACGGGAQDDDARNDAAGFEADIRFVDLEGLDAALAEYRGKGVLLNFWAIWCAPCVAELPELFETADEFADQGGNVVTVSYDLMIPGETRDTVRGKLEAFAAEKGMEVPILVYDADDYEAINDRFEIPGPIPVTLALDEKGEIVERQHGAAGKERFDEMMRRALR